LISELIPGEETSYNRIFGISLNTNTVGRPKIANKQNCFIIHFIRQREEDNEESEGKDNKRIRRCNESERSFIVAGRKKETVRRKKIEKI
jgi:hypothetical protein